MSLQRMKGPYSTACELTAVRMGYRRAAALQVDLTPLPFRRSSAAWLSWLSPAQKRRTHLQLEFLNRQDLQGLLSLVALLRAFVI